MTCLFPKKRIDGVLALVGGFSLHLTLGTLYCFGNMSTYMTSYLKKNVDPNIAYSDMVWIPTLATIGQGVFMTLSGYLEEAIGVRPTVAMGASLMTAGVYLTYFSIRTSVAATVTTYGLMFGLGTAFAYAPPLGVAMRWFPDRKGTVNGVIVGGFGLGAFVFNQVQSIYLNPLNEQVGADGYFHDDKILDRVPSVFLLLGSIYGVIQMLAVLLIRPPPDVDPQAMLPLLSHADDEESDAEASSFLEDEAEEQLLADDVHSDTGRLADGRLALDRRPSDLSNRSASRVGLDGSDLLPLPPPADMDNLKPRQIRRSREFWILWATFFLNTQAVTYINSMYKAYGQEFIKDDHFLAVVGAIAAIFNASGRIVWGHLCDRVGYRSCMVVITTAIALLYSTFYFVPVSNKAVFATYIWAIFFAFCGSFVLLPTVTASCFGTKYLSKNYGLVMTGQAVAAPLTAVMTQVLSPIVGWLGMFLIIATFSITCAILNWVAFPKHPSPRQILDRLYVQPSHL